MRLHDTAVQPHFPRRPLARRGNPAQTAGRQIEVNHFIFKGIGVVPQYIVEKIQLKMGLFVQTCKDRRFKTRLLSRFGYR